MVNAKQKCLTGIFLLLFPLLARGEEAAKENKLDLKIPLICAGVIVASSFLDRTIRDHLAPQSDSAATNSLRRFGDIGQLAGPIIGTLFAIHGEATDNTKSIDTAVLSYESFIVSGGISAGIKFVVGRKRPSATDNPYDFKPFSSDSSFPSGHTTTAFAAATVFSEQYPEWWVIVPSYGVASVVGYSRLAANKHWFSDVVAAAIVGSSTSHLLRLRRKKKNKSGWQVLIDPSEILLVRTF